MDELIANRTISAAEIRLALHYARMLAQAKSLLEQGVESAMLANNLIISNWAQIELWQGWAAKNWRSEQTITQLTTDFARFGYPIIDIVLPPDRGIQWQEQGLTCARKLGDLSAELTHLEALTAYYSVLGTHEQAAAYGNAALTLAQQLNDENTEARVMEALGNSLAAQGKYDLARNAYETILAYSIQWADESRRIDGLSMLGYLFLQMNQYTLARATFEQCLELQLQRGNTLGAVRYYGQLCFTTLLDNDLEMSREYALKSIAVFRSFQDQHTLLVGENRQNHTAIEFDGSANTNYFEISLRISQIHGRQEVVSIVLASYGRNLLQTGNLDAAYPLLLQSRDLASSIGFKQSLLITLCCLSNLHCQHGNLREAEIALSEAFTLFTADSGDYLACLLLVEAVYLYVRYGTAAAMEQAALWIGLLDTQTALQRYSLDELSQQRSLVEAQIGFQETARLVEQGALLSTTTEITQLRKVMNAITTGPVFN